MEKTATDQTSKRSSKTKPSTIQPPPLTGIFEVPVSGSLLAREPENVIRQAVEYATLEWVDWFNNCRLLEPNGNIPPAEAEANFYAALERKDMAA